MLASTGIGLAVFCLLLSTNVDAQSCPAISNVAQACVSGTYTGSRVLVDMSSFTEEVSDCACSFTTDSRVLKILTYNAPNYQDCNSAIRMSSSSGNSVRFQCLMSGTYLDTSIHNTGTISFETYAPAYDTNYCLVMEQTGVPGANITVTCNGPVVSTPLPDITTVAPPGFNEITSSSSADVTTQTIKSTHSTSSTPKSFTAEATGTNTTTAISSSYTTTEKPSTFDSLVNETNSSGAAITTNLSSAASADVPVTVLLSTPSSSQYNISDARAPNSTAGTSSESVVSSTPGLNTSTASAAVGSTSSLSTGTTESVDIDSTSNVSTMKESVAATHTSSSSTGTESAAVGSTSSVSTGTESAAGTESEAASSTSNVSTGTESTTVSGTTSVYKTTESEAVGSTFSIFTGTESAVVDRTSGVSTGSESVAVASVSSVSTGTESVAVNITSNGSTENPNEATTESPLNITSFEYGSPANISNMLDSFVQDNISVSSTASNDTITFVPDEPSASESYAPITDIVTGTVLLHGGDKSGKQYQHIDPVKANMFEDTANITVESFIPPEPREAVGVSFVVEKIENQHGMMGETTTVRSTFGGNKMQDVTSDNYWLASGSSGKEVTANNNQFVDGFQRSNTVTNVYGLADVTPVRDITTNSYSFSESNSGVSRNAFASDNTRQYATTDRYQSANYGIEMTTQTNSFGNYGTGVTTNNYAFAEGNSRKEMTTNVYGMAGFNSVSQSATRNYDSVTTDFRNVTSSSHSMIKSSSDSLSTNNYAFTEENINNNSTSNNYKSTTMDSTSNNYSYWLVRDNTIGDATSYGGIANNAGVDVTNSSPNFAEGNVNKEIATNMTGAIGTYPPQDLTNQFDYTHNNANNTVYASANQELTTEQPKASTNEPDLRTTDNSSFDRSNSTIDKTTSEINSVVDSTPTDKVDSMASYRQLDLTNQFDNTLYNSNNSTNGKTNLEGTTVQNATTYNEPGMPTTNSYSSFDRNITGRDITTENPEIATNTFDAFDSYHQANVTDQFNNPSNDTYSSSIAMGHTTEQASAVNGESTNLLSTDSYNFRDKNNAGIEVTAGIANAADNKFKNEITTNNYASTGTYSQLDFANQFDYSPDNTNMKMNVDTKQERTTEKSEAIYNNIGSQTTDNYGSIDTNNAGRDVTTDSPNAFDRRFTNEITPNTYDSFGSYRQPDLTNQFDTISERTNNTLDSLTTEQQSGIASEPANQTTDRYATRDITTRSPDTIYSGFTKEIPTNKYDTAMTYTQTDFMNQSTSLTNNTKDIMNSTAHVGPTTEQPSTIKTEQGLPAADNYSFFHRNNLMDTRTDKYNYFESGQTVQPYTSGAETATSRTVDSYVSGAATGTSSTADSYASGAATDTSSTVDQYATGNATDTSRTVEPYASGAATDTSRTVEPYANGAATDTSRTVEPYASGAATATSRTVEPYASGAATATSRTVEPYATGAATATSRTVEPYASGTATDTSSTVDPYVSGAATDTSRTVEPYASGAETDTSRTEEPYTSGAATATSKTLEPYASGAVTATSRTVEPYASGVATDIGSTVAPYDSGAATATSRTVEPYSSGAATATGRTAESYASGTATNTRRIVEPYTSGAATATRQAVEPYSSGAATDTSRTEEPYASGVATDIGITVEPYASGLATATSRTVEPYSIGVATDIGSTVEPYASGAASATRKTVEPYSSGAAIDTSGAVKPYASGSATATGSTVETYASGAATDTSRTVEPYASEAAADTGSTVEPYVSGDTNRTVEAYASGTATDTSRTVEPYTSGASTDTSRTVEPYVTGAATDTGRTVEPYVTGAATDTSRTVEPYASGAATDTSRTVEPYATGAATDTSRTVEPYASGAVTDTSRTVEPYATGAATDTSRTVEPYSSGAVTDTGRTVEPYASGAATDTSRTVEPYVTGAATDTGRTVEPYVTGAATDTSRTVEPYASGAATDTSRTVEPYASGAATDTSRTVEPYTSGAETDTSRTVEPYASGAATDTSRTVERYVTGAATDTSWTVEPYVSGASTDTSSTVESYASGAATDTGSTVEPYASGAATATSRTVEPYASGAATDTSRTVEPFASGAATDTSRTVQSYTSGAETGTSRTVEPYASGTVTTTSRTVEPYTSGAETATSSTVEPYVSGAATDTSRTVEPYASGAATDTSRTVKSYTSGAATATSRTVEPYASGAATDTSRTVEPYASGAATDTGRTVEPYATGAATDTSRTVEPYATGAATDTSRTVEPYASGAVTDTSRTVEPYASGAATDTGRTVEPYASGAATDTSRTVEPYASGAVTDTSRTVEPYVSGDTSRTVEPYATGAATDTSSTVEPYASGAATDTSRTVEPYASGAATDTGSTVEPYASGAATDTGSTVAPYVSGDTSSTVEPHASGAATDTSYLSDRTQAKMDHMYEPAANDAGTPGAVNNGMHSLDLTLNTKSTLSEIQFPTETPMIRETSAPLDISSTTKPYGSEWGSTATETFSSDDSFIRSTKDNTVSHGLSSSTTTVTDTASQASHTETAYFDGVSTMPSTRPWTDSNWTDNNLLNRDTTASDTTKLNETSTVTGSYNGIAPGTTFQDNSITSVEQSAFSMTNESAGNNTTEGMGAFDNTAFDSYAFDNAPYGNENDAPTTQPYSHNRDMSGINNDIAPTRYPSYPSSSSDVAHIDTNDSVARNGYQGNSNDFYMNAYSNNITNEETKTFVNTNSILNSYRDNTTPTAGNTETSLYQDYSMNNEMNNEVTANGNTMGSGLQSVPTFVAGSSDENITNSYQDVSASSHLVNATERDNYGYSSDMAGVNASDTLMSSLDASVNGAFMNETVNTNKDQENSYRNADSNTSDPYQSFNSYSNAVPSNSFTIVNGEPTVRHVTGSAVVGSKVNTENNSPVGESMFNHTVPKTGINEAVTTASYNSIADTVNMYNYNSVQPENITSDQMISDLYGENTQSTSNETFSNNGSVVSINTDISSESTPNYEQSSLNTDDTIAVNATTGIDENPNITIIDATPNSSPLSNQDMDIGESILNAVQSPGTMSPTSPPATDPFDHMFDRGSYMNNDLISTESQQTSKTIVKLENTIDTTLPSTDAFPTTVITPEDMGITINETETPAAVPTAPILVTDGSMETVVTVEAKPVKGDVLVFDLQTPKPPMGSVSLLSRNAGGAEKDVSTSASSTIPLTTPENPLDIVDSTLPSTDVLLNTMETIEDTGIIKNESETTPTAVPTAPIIVPDDNTEAVVTETMVASEIKPVEGKPVESDISVFDSRNPNLSTDSTSLLSMNSDVTEKDASDNASSTILLTTPETPFDIIDSTLPSTDVLLNTMDTIEDTGIVKNESETIPTAIPTAPIIERDDNMEAVVTETMVASEIKPVEAKPVESDISVFDLQNPNLSTDSVNLLSRNSGVTEKDVSSTTLLTTTEKLLTTGSTTTVLSKQTTTTQATTSTTTPPTTARFLPDIIPRDFVDIVESPVLDSRPPVSESRPTTRRTFVRIPETTVGPVADGETRNKSTNGKDINVSFGDTYKAGLFDMDNNTYIIVVAAIAGLVVLAAILGIVIHHGRRGRSEKVDITGDGPEPISHRNLAYESMDPEKGNVSSPNEINGSRPSQEANGNGVTPANGHKGSIEA